MYNFYKSIRYAVSLIVASQLFRFGLSHTLRRATHSCFATISFRAVAL